tara:strand:- start:2280 stop:4271 length:1992 start_codon:yes stop_codon:yes gene_type:complete
MSGGALERVSGGGAIATTPAPSRVESWGGIWDGVTVRDGKGGNTAESVQVRREDGITISPPYGDGGLDNTIQRPPTPTPEERRIETNQNVAGLARDKQNANLLIFYNQGRDIAHQHSVCDIILTSMEVHDGITKTDKMNVLNFLNFAQPSSSKTIWERNMHGKIKDTDYISGGLREGELFKRNDQLMFLRFLPDTIRSLSDEEFIKTLRDEYDGIPLPLARDLQILMNARDEADAEARSVVPESSMALVALPHEGSETTPSPNLKYKDSTMFTPETLVQKGVSIITKFFHDIVLIDFCENERLVTTTLIGQKLTSIESDLRDYEHLWFEPIYRQFKLFIERSNEGYIFNGDTLEQREKHLRETWRLFVESFVQKCIKQTVGAVLMNRRAFLETMEMTFNAKKPIQGLSEATKDQITSINTAAIKWESSKIRIIESLDKVGRAILQKFLMHDDTILDLGSNTTCMTVTKSWVTGRLIKNGKLKMTSHTDIMPFHGDQWLSAEQSLAEKKYLEYKRQPVLAWHKVLDPAFDAVMGQLNAMKDMVIDGYEGLSSGLTNMVWQAVVTSMIGAMFVFMVKFPEVVNLPIRTTVHIGNSLIRAITKSEKIEREFEETSDSDKKGFLMRLFLPLCKAFRGICHIRISNVEQDAQAKTESIIPTNVESVHI